MIQSGHKPLLRLLAENTSNDLNQNSKIGRNFIWILLCS